MISTAIYTRFSAKPAAFSKRIATGELRAGRVSRRIDQRRARDGLGARLRRAGQRGCRGGRPGQTCLFTDHRGAAAGRALSRKLSLGQAGARGLEDSGPARAGPSRAKPCASASGRAGRGQSGAACYGRRGPGARAADRKTRPGPPRGLTSFSPPSAPGGAPAPPSPAPGRRSPGRPRDRGPPADRGRTELRDRRPDARVDAGDGQRQLADRRPGGDVHEQLRQLLALLPLARHLPHRPVHAQPPRAQQQGARAAASAASRPCTETTTSRSGCSAPATTPP